MGGTDHIIKLVERSNIDGAEVVVAHISELEREVRRLKTCLEVVEALRNFDASRRFSEAT